MKKTLLVLSALVALCSSAFAQSAEEAFYPGWQFAIKGGATYTAGESSFKNLISVPTIALGAGYQFTPVFTLRGELSGLQAKGAVPAYEAIYKFNYGQLNLDGVFDICNMFKFKSTRTINPYIFVGIGGNVRFNNSEANAIKTAHPQYSFDYAWSDPTISFTGRFGGGIDFRLSDAVRISLEVVDNVLTDKFNSKKGESFQIGKLNLDFDYNISALLGLKFTFGQANKKAAAIAAAAAAAEAKAAADAAAAAAAAKAAAEKAAAEKAAAEAAAKAAAEKAAAEKAAAEKAAAEAAAKAAKEAAWENAKNDPSRNVFFTIGKSNINYSENKKIQNIAKLLKENPEMTAEIVGAADSATGSEALNWTLSEKRAAAVKAALVKLGVDEDRISTRFLGGTMELSQSAAKNRVAICVTE